MDKEARERPGEEVGGGDADLGPERGVLRHGGHVPVEKRRDLKQRGKTLEGLETRRNDSYERKDSWLNSGGGGGTVVARAQRPRGSQMPPLPPYGIG